MIISKADFLQSNTRIDKLPPEKFPEYAFIGRSNVGKSSLINMLTGKKNLAKTSSTPGKTITINHFVINDSWYIVDLPGYGFAKRSRSSREQWKKMLSDYLRKRQNLIFTFVLIDCRIEPQKIDLEFINWLGEKQLPFVLVFTKADKLSKKVLAENISNYKKQLLTEWEELPTIIISSSTSGDGKDEILNLIENENQTFGTGIYSSSNNT